MKLPRFLKKILPAAMAVLALVTPLLGSAQLSVDQFRGGSVGGLFGFTAQSFLVLDKASGRTIISKNEAQTWPTASLAKLVTALVVLEQKPNLNTSIAMQKQDEVGGARIATKAGVKYKLNDLLHASLVASANNATNALSRGSGFGRDEFVMKMNEKAKSLGTTNSQFFEPTGIDPRNTTTAEDYAKIIQAALDNPTIAAVVKKETYAFRSSNNSRYSHKIKTTNKLLADPDFSVLGGKTGYLEESMYNFAAEIKDKFGNLFVVVILGSQNPTAQFKETKELAWLGGLYTIFNPLTNILGSSTTTPLSLN